ncbi:MAG TPA: LPP20 family lipoprotein [bacterium]|nr:LPP20 family lipoprotein [bacterium]
MKKILMGLLAAGLLAAGCGGNKAEVKPEAQVEGPVKPAWVDKGGVYMGDKGSIVEGVGIADKGPNISLMREKADSRARADLAAQLKVAVKKLTSDYMSDHKDYFDQANTAGSDEMTTVVSKQVVDQVLVGSHIVDRWTDPETGALYALARMDIGDGLYDAYEAALKRALKSQHKLATQQDMKAAMADLDKEVADQRQHEDKIIGANQSAPAVEMGSTR